MSFIISYSVSRGFSVYLRYSGMGVGYLSLDATLRFPGVLHDYCFVILRSFILSCGPPARPSGCLLHYLQFYSRSGMLALKLLLSCHLYVRGIGYPYGVACGRLYYFRVSFWSGLFFGKFTLMFTSGFECPSFPYFLLFFSVAFRYMQLLSFLSIRLCLLLLRCFE